MTWSGVLAPDPSVPNGDLRPAPGQTGNTETHLPSLGSHAHRQSAVSIHFGGFWGRVGNSTRETLRVYGHTQRRTIAVSTTQSYAPYAGAGLSGAGMQASVRPTIHHAPTRDKREKGTCAYVGGGTSWAR